MEFRDWLKANAGEQVLQQDQKVEIGRRWAQFDQSDGFGELNLEVRCFSFFPLHFSHSFLAFSLSWTAYICSTFLTF